MSYKIPARRRNLPRPIAIAAAAMLLGLSACATEPAPYAPKTAESTTGYTDLQLTATRYRITFTGNSATDRQRVEDYLLLRSAQVTINAGYSWFVFDTRNTQADTTYRSTFTGWPGWRSYGYYWHSYTWGPPASMTARPSTKYQAYAEIALLTDAQAKNEPRAVNAHEIVQHLKPTAASETAR